MDSRKLKQLIAKEEGFKLDFKLKLSLELESEKKEFVKDVIAMANTVGGRGYILFGIEDKTKRIVGIEDIPEDMEERIQQMICHRSDPPVPIQFEIVDYEDKKIGVLTIFKSIQVPHQMLGIGAFYIRRGSTTGVANREEIAKMLQRYGLVSFESVPCRQATEKDLDEEMLKKYLGVLMTQVGEKALLLSLGILSEGEREGVYYPTYGGLLLFGKAPQCFIPQSLVEVHLPDKVVGLRGNISKMLEDFEKIIGAYLSQNYPLEALKEVMGNAVIHRDYWNTHLYTSVYVTENAIEIINPNTHGHRINEKTKIRTNPWLYSRLLLLQKKEETLHFGTGIESVKQSFKQEEDRFKISYDLEEGLVQVSLPGIGQKNKEVPHDTY